MKKLLLLALYLAPAITLLAAEENDRYEAWYIGRNKDTSFGHIIARHPDSLYFSVLFENSDGSTIRLLPAQVKRFGINILDTWRVYTVLDLGEPTGLKDSSTLIYAQVLNEEEHVKYYKYQYFKAKPGRYNNDMYVQGERAIVTEHCLIKKGEILRFQTNSLFNSTKKQLRSFFSDCDIALAGINQVKNITDQLPVIVRQYNRCWEKKK
jgi:IS1 family transposase